MKCLGFEADSELVLPSSRKLFTDEEEADLFIQDALKSQKDFEGMNLNQVLNSRPAVLMILYAKNNLDIQRINYYGKSFVFLDKGLKSSWKTREKQR